MILTFRVRDNDIRDIDRKTQRERVIGREGEERESGGGEGL